MGGDIVNRLRNRLQNEPLVPIAHEAADEIERLRADNRTLQDQLSRALKVLEKQHDKHR